MTNTTRSATCITIIISTLVKKCYKSKSDNVTTVHSTKLVYLLIISVCGEPIRKLEIQ